METKLSDGLPLLPAHLLQAMIQTSHQSEIRFLAQIESCGFDSTMMCATVAAARDEHRRA